MSKKKLPPDVLRLKKAWGKLWPEHLQNCRRVIHRLELTPDEVAGIEHVVGSARLLMLLHSLYLEMF